MDANQNDKIERVLQIYTRLMNGGVVNKAAAAAECGVTERSIQRDVDDIRKFLELEADQSGLIRSVVYDREKKGYRLDQPLYPMLTNAEILAICKILLDSRAFTRPEMMQMLEKLIACCVPQGQRELVSELIRNEAFHYIEPHHKTVFLDTMWSLGEAIRSCRYVEIRYARLKENKTVTRRIKPAAIMFSEYYFYLAAFIDDAEVRKGFDAPDDPFPTIYRIDRIKRLKVCKEHFRVLYANRFEEGEFRKRVQFMYGGRICRVKFRYSGTSIEAVLDRLPTAQILEEKDGVYTVSAEVFGKGIYMWLRGQGDAVEVLEGGETG